MNPMQQPLYVGFPMTSHYTAQYAQAYNPSIYGTGAPVPQQNFAQQQSYVPSPYPMQAAQPQGMAPQTGMNGRAPYMPQYQGQFPQQQQIPQAQRGAMRRQAMTLPVGDRTKDATFHRLLTGTRASNDLRRLQQTMEDYERMGGRWVECKYSVNWWDYQNWWLPLRHHGLLLKGNTGHFLSLDFGTNGLTWDFDVQAPILSQYTTVIEDYEIDVAPTSVSEFSLAQPAFSYLGFDCNAWTQNFLDEVCELSKQNRPHKRIAEQHAMCSVYR
jgi:hypothetical protein